MPAAPHRSSAESDHSHRNLDKFPEIRRAFSESRPSPACRTGNGEAFGIPRQFLYSRYWYPVGAMPDPFSIISKKQTGEEGQFSFRKFRPEELVAIYFGCRCSSESRERIIAAISNWETPVSRFQMRDERIRFELTTEPI